MSVAACNELPSGKHPMSLLHEMYSGNELTVDVIQSLSGIYVARVLIAEHDFQREFLVRLY